MFALVTLSLWLGGALLMPAGAHLLEMPRKLAMDRDAYFVAQQLYAGWALAGVPMLAKIALDVLLALRLRQRDSRAACAFLLSAAAIFVGLLVFVLRVQPADLATANWTQTPADWAELRESWENGHFVVAVLTLLAFGFTCAAAMRAAAGAHTTRLPARNDDAPASQTPRRRARRSLQKTAAVLERRISRRLGPTAAVRVVLTESAVVLAGDVGSAADVARAERAARRFAADPARIDNRLVVAPDDRRAAADDQVYEASQESFPASDPPAWIFR